MASFGHVRNALLKGYFKIPNMRSENCVRAINSLTGTYSCSWTRRESKIVHKSQQLVWGDCPSLSFSARIHVCNAASCAPSSDNSSPGNTGIKHNSHSAPSSCANPFNPALVEDLIKNMDGDMPVTEMPDPFEKKYHRCFLCRNNIVPDHKNVRLLSQFVSPYTGRIYGRAITGLCIPMQKHVASLIKRARYSGFMAYSMKDPKYLQDPQPYDAMSKKYNKQ
jgi:small subunit ribosomal protein S18